MKRLLWLQRSAISSSSSSTTVAAAATTTITAITTQAMILDGGEWNSLQQNQQQQQGRSSSSRSTTSTSNDGVGRVVAVVGTLNSQRVVGLLRSTSSTTNSLEEKGIAIQLDNPFTSTTTTSTIAPGETCMVEPKSIVYIPNDISNEQAIWTALFCISRVYALWPTTPGPSDYDDGNGTTASATTTTSSSKNELLLLPHPNIWIIGGNDDAVTTMNILTTLGANVTMIAKNRPKSLPGNFYSAENDIPFADGLLTPVDGILDVVGDEVSTMIGSTLLPGEPWKCQNYVSLKTHSLSLIETNGLFSGPGKVQQYTKRIIATAASSTTTPTSRSSSSTTNNNNNKYQNQNPAATTATNVNYAPPIGKFLDQMLKAKCLFTKPKDLKDSVYCYVRTWELADFWESTTWPRQFMSNVRYGWPTTITMNDDDDDDELYETPDGTKPSTKMMISAPPSSRGNPFAQTNLEELDEDDNDNDRKESSSLSSPDVTWITDSLAVDTIITQPRKTAVVFVSAPFCRTCRYLKPLYQRMAKQYKDCQQQQQQQHSDRSVVEFCQADASGPVGKILSRKLGIDAVPSFLLFRHGKRFGPPLSVSRIPSPKLDLAISWILDENAVWDDGAMRAMDEKEKRRKIM